MKIYLDGHSYRYAVEQMVLQLLENEKPEFVEETPQDGDFAVVSLDVSGTAASASVRLVKGGKAYRGRAVNSRAPTEGEVRISREHQRLIKLALFRALRQVTTRELPWGATTGIRPSTLLTRMVRTGVPLQKATQRLIREYYVSPDRAVLAESCALAELAVRETLSVRDIALYIGIPFCPTRCAYCSFVSQSVEKSMGMLSPFLETLGEEIDTLSDLIEKLGLSVVSVYIGGGTPTTLSAEQLDELLTHLYEAFDLSKMRDFTVEAGRPDTITQEKLHVLKAHGVTRISVNPQTMSDEVLTLIGRRHTAEDTCRAYEMVRSAGFGAVNMDLIAGLPGNTAEGFRDSLRQVIALSPENITVHTLSLKRGSRVTLEGTPVPDGGAVSKMLSFAFSALSDYRPYYLYRQKFTSGGFENTGFAKSGHESLYNIIMMDEVRSVLALGSGVTKLVTPEGYDNEGRIERIFSPKYPYEYIERREDILLGKRRIRDFYERLLTDGV